MNPFRPPIPATKYTVIKNSSGEWQSIMSFVLSCSDIRKSICGGCPTSRLYDKNGVVYKFSRANTLEQVKEIVEKIRTINAQP